MLDIGVVQSLQFDNKDVEIGKAGQDICIKVRVVL